MVIKSGRPEALWPTVGRIGFLFQLQHENPTGGGPTRGRRLFFALSWDRTDRDAGTETPPYAGPAPSSARIPTLERISMRYVIFVIDSPDNTAGGDEMAAIDAFNDRLEADGHWIFAAGICGPDKAVRIDNRAGAGIVTSGSLQPGPEHYSGFWLINAPDDATAQRLATEGSHACNRKVELRAFLR
jgi:hypothetical protein